jgi:peptide/nickel transport system substrate-binding protein
VRGGTQRKHGEESKVKNLSEQHQERSPQGLKPNRLPLFMSELKLRPPKEKKASEDQIHEGMSFGTQEGPGFSLENRGWCTPRLRGRRNRGSSLAIVVVCGVAAVMGACGQQVQQRPGEVTFLIEANPTNLDPRYATDVQSQKIGALLYNGLVQRDAEMNLHGDLAESWETPDALTYVFHLRKGVKFHDGREVTSRDVKATIEYMMNPENRSPKRGAFRMIGSIEAPDAHTVVFHLKEPAASFAWNMERSAVGIVPADAGNDFARHPIGSGSFRFVSQTQDDAVVVERNENYFSRDEEERKEQGQRRDAESAEIAQRRGDQPIANGAMGGPPLRSIERVTFRIVPDAIVRALELRKGSADVEMSSLSPDMIPVLAKQPGLEVTERPGTNFAYLGMNLEDPILRHREVRQALAYATDRESLIKYLLRDEAKLASGLLPPNHWAYEPEVQKYGYDPEKAERLLDAAGFVRKNGGVRFQVMLKVSTEEQARIVGAALQEQWRKVGVELEVRPLELATLFSDLGKGHFQISYLRWVGANNDPDVFELVFHSKRIPPDGPNRGRYRNAKVDALTDGIRTEMDREKRKELCSEVQKIVAEELPYIPLWYVDVVSVHRRGMKVELTPTGDYEFLVGR